MTTDHDRQTTHHVKNWLSSRQKSEEAYYCRPLRNMKWKVVTITKKSGASTSGYDTARRCDLDCTKLIRWHALGSPLSVATWIHHSPDTPCVGHCTLDSHYAPIQCEALIPLQRLSPKLARGKSPRQKLWKLRTQMSRRLRQSPQHCRPLRRNVVVMKFGLNSLALPSHQAAPMIGFQPCF